MKLNVEKKYFLGGLTAFLVIAGSICFYYLIFHADRFSAQINEIFKVASPVLYGIILAYLLTPAVNSIERHILKPILLKTCKSITSTGKKIMRAISIILTMIIACFLIYGLFRILIPNIITSIENISLQFPTYIQNLTKWSAEFLKDNPNIEKLASQLVNTYSSEFTNFLNNSIIPGLESILKQVSMSLISVLGVLWDFIIGIIISIYVLFNKETFAGQAKKIVYAFLQTKTANSFIRDVRFTSDTFIGFLSGKIVDSAIIGCLCFAATSLLDMPYFLLISVIIGVTNIIPFFGPFLGAIPCAFLVLMVNPIKCIYFVILIFILQQLDGNVIGPKILGESTGLSGFWVIFSITIFGGLWGVPGMIVGVPFWAVIYAMVRRVTNRHLKKRDLPTDTGEYLNVDYIKDNELVQRDTEQTKSFFKLKRKKAAESNEINKIEEVSDSDN
ncbi:MAG: AI-2E family transporter [Lachnospiraceae bacterium]|nr:AI-2E family transporter [Lachnospiraceae bacterium]